MGFTRIAIRNLGAGDKRRAIPDPGCAGLYVIVQPSGKKSFAVRYRFDCRPKKLALPGGLTLAAARKLAGDALLAVEQGHDPAIEKKASREKIKAAKADTVHALCENYLRRVAVTDNSAHGGRRRSRSGRGRWFTRLDVCWRRSACVVAQEAEASRLI